MESSLLYQGFSLRKQKCLCTEYKDKVGSNNYIF